MASKHCECGGELVRLTETRPRKLSVGAFCWAVDLGAALHQEVTFSICRVCGRHGRERRGRLVKLETGNKQ